MQALLQVKKTDRVQPCAKEYVRVSITAFQLFPHEVPACVLVKVIKPEGTEQGGVSLDVRPEKDNAYFWSKRSY